MRRSAALPAGFAALVLAATGCTGPVASPTPSAHTSAPPASHTPSHSPTPTPTETTQEPPTATECAAAIVDDMSLSEQVGQTVMAGVTNASASELAVVKKLKLGSVIMMGQHTDGVSGVKQVTARLQRLDLDSPLLISVDQEGGLVQRFKGRGFDTIPSAKVQSGWSNATLTARATTWGKQLAAAGVNWTHAPVTDTVPANMTTRNQPIGALNRGYGSNPATVGSKVSAFIKGMEAAGIATSPKHFPGIGRVVGNTDFTAGVKDTLTTANDPYLQPFAAAIKAGAPSVMVSTVTYTRIDAKQPAVFSATVIGLLRDKLGFDGVIITDDLGAAKSMSSVPTTQRGVRVIKAGGDIAMTVTPGLADEFVAGIRSAARSDAATAEQVKQAATRVVAMKIGLGLVPCG